MTAEDYLTGILQAYSPRDLSIYSQSISILKNTLKQWANTCYLDVIDSGSRAKGTAISLASDVDYLVSLTSQCDENSGGLKHIYDSLFDKLNGSYTRTRKQNVSIRITIGKLEVDVTPARRQNMYTSDHWIYLSKKATRQQTNIQKHISDISNSGITREIRIIKTWRELNKLDFPSIYLEYLLRDNILANRTIYYQSFAENAFYAFQQFARDQNNPLYARMVDPANSNNILSELLTNSEKQQIVQNAKIAASKRYWSDIIW